MCLDGDRIISGGRGGYAMLWNTTTGQVLGKFPKFSGVICSIALFSDDKRAVLGGGYHDNTVRIWNFDDGAELQTFRGHTNAVWGVAVSPDDCTVASASNDRTIKIWNIHSGKCQATLTGHRSDVNIVAFSQDGQTLASGSDDGTIKL